MNLKRAGKRVLYFVGGIALTLVSVIVLIAIVSSGGNWIDQITIYLYGGIILGIAVIVTSFQKNINGTTEKINDNNPGDSTK